MPGVGEFGVINKNGVSNKGVAVNSGEGVSVFSPTNVGVTVKVSVGVIGVNVGASVGMFVEAGNGVGVATGSKNSCSNVREQEESSMAQIRKTILFFM